MGRKGEPCLPNPARGKRSAKPPPTFVAPVHPEDPHGTAQCHACGRVVRLRALPSTFGDEGEQLYAFPTGWAFGNMPTGYEWSCSAACLHRNPKMES